MTKNNVIELKCRDFQLFGTHEDISSGHEFSFIIIRILFFHDETDLDTIFFLRSNLLIIISGIRILEQTLEHQSFQVNV